MCVVLRAVLLWLMFESVRYLPSIDATDATFNLSQVCLILLFIFLEAAS